MAKEIIYDAIIVGSGATGGWAAKELSEKGMRVIVLEAGRKLDPMKDFTEHTWPYEVKYRGTVGNRTLFRERQPIQSKCYACNEYGNHFFVDDIDNPYTTPDGKPVRLDSRQARRRPHDYVGPPGLSPERLRA